MPVPVPSPTSDHLQADVTALATFVACARKMLDPDTSEDHRRQAEARLLSQLPAVQALRVFEIFSVRDPALAALLRDELDPLSWLDVDGCSSGAL